MATETQNLRLDQIRIDGGTQPRVAINEGIVAEYADLYRSGVDLPPLTVFYDGTAYWLADGFHRFLANKRIDCEYVFAEVHQGTVQDAQWHSFGANAAHGLRRTNADKEKAVRAALAHPKGVGMSDRDLAQHVGVTNKTVGKYRSEMESTEEIPQLRTRTGRDGRTRNTSNIGRRRSPAKPSPQPQIMTKAEYEAEAAEANADTSPPRPQAPSKAIAKGQEAINLLKSILPSDPRCVEAMHMVRDWIIHNFG